MFDILRLEYVQQRPRFKGDQQPLETVFYSSGPAVFAFDANDAIKVAKRLGFIAPIVEKVKEHA